MASCLSRTSKVVTFRYQALNPEEKEIRLVDVEPLEAGAQTVVQCRLRHASLNDKPTYTALSYVWGEPDVTKVICLDDKEVHVTTNLESALRHLATDRRSDGGQGRTVWVDAICIDQRNEAERTQQVSQMSAIYSNATLTFLWLGPASGDSGLAIDTLERMSETARAVGYYVSSWSTFRFTDTEPAEPWVTAVRNTLDTNLAELCREESARLVAVSRLFKRAWFRRVWVIQERVLSPNSIVCCGSDWITWNAFYDGFWLLCGIRDYLNIVGAGTGRRDSSALAAFLTTVLDRVTPVSFTKRRNSLLVLFSMLSTAASKTPLQASDPRDYVFGLLGLIEPTMSPEISADYTKDWKTVQIEVAEDCLQYYGPRILSFAGVGHAPESPGARKDDAPSWAPDWSSEYLPQPLIIPSIFVVRGRNRKLTYMACGNLTQSLLGAFSANHRLSLQAFFVDEVEILGKPLPEVDAAAEDWVRVATLAHWLQDFDSLLPCANEVYRTAEAAGEARWRTPIADRAYAYNWETERASAETYSAYWALRGGGVEAGVKYANIAGFKLHRRRPLRSAKGYIGLGPQGASKGDSIWILPGADVPFILRPVADGSFCVVGEAYVHGVMDGELSPSAEGLQTVQLA